MTVNTLKAKLSVDLGDIEGAFYTDSDYLDSSQDGYDEISVFCGNLNSETTLNFGSDVYYDFSSLISDYFAVLRIFNLNTNRWLIPSSVTEMDQIRRDWELMEGEPTWFFPNGPKHIAIIPHHSTPTGQMIVYYRSKAPILVLGTTIQVPLTHEQVLEDYVKMDLLEQAKEFGKAGLEFNQYLRKLKHLSNFVKRFGFPDKRLSL